MGNKVYDYGDGYHAKCVRQYIASSESNPSGGISITKDIGTHYDLDVRFQWAFSTAFAVNGRYCYIYKDSTIAITIRVDGSGNVIANVTDTGFDVVINKWYDFRIKTNRAASTFALYINGDLIGTYTFTAAAAYLNKIQFRHDVGNPISTSGYQEFGLSGVVSGGSTGIVTTATRGYQELGLTGKTLSSPITLGDWDEYEFYAIVDGTYRQVYGYGNEYGGTIGGLINHINACIGTWVIAELIGGDIRITSKTYGASSTVSCVDGFDYYQVLGAIGASPETPVNGGGTDITYSFRISVNGGSYVSINKTGALLQTFSELIATINSSLSGAAMAIVSGDLRITSSTTGSTSTISILAGLVGTDMLVSLGASMETPVDGYVQDGYSTFIDNVAYKEKTYEKFIVTRSAQNDLGYMVAECLSAFVFTRGREAPPTSLADVSKTATQATEKAESVGSSISTHASNENANSTNVNIYRYIGTTTSSWVTVVDLDTLDWNNYDYAEIDIMSRENGYTNGEHTRIVCYRSGSGAWTIGATPINYAWGSTAGAHNVQFSGANLQIQRAASTNNSYTIHIKMMRGYD